MNFVDLSANSRIASVMDLTRALRESRNPYEALLKYCAYLASAFPQRGQLILSTKGLPAGEYRVWRLRTDDGLEHLPARDPWKDFNTRVYRGGIIGRITQMMQPQLIHDMDWSDDPYFARELSPYHSLIAVPLFNERLTLNWSLMLARDPNHFSVAELEESVTRATLIGSLIDSLYVGKELSEAHAYIDQELERMARIQRALLPEPIPRIPGLQLAAAYETFIQVGGDLYDIIPLDGQTDRWCFFIGDASGHGPSAAVAAAMVQATLHACAPDAAGPAQLFRTLNRHLCHKPIEDSFVTAFLGFYDPPTRRLIHASAGHPLPLVSDPARRAVRSVEAAGGIPLGIDPDASFDEASVRLEPGETLLLYTDGISEARAPDDAMFGPDGIEQSLRGYAAAAPAVIDRVRQSLRAHQRGRSPVDDQTLVAAQVQV